MEKFINTLEDYYNSLLLEVGYLLGKCNCILEGFDIIPFKEISPKEEKKLKSIYKKVEKLRDEVLQFQNTIR